MKTQARILSAALSLFNQRGTAQVTTNHIAEAAGISPGNLYYHFRNKEAIIRALCGQLFARTAELGNPESDRAPTLEDVQGWVRENFATTFEYAFVYRELPALIRHDATLATTYAEVRERGYQGFRELIAVLVAVGVFADTLSEAEVEALADLLWLLSEHWLTSLELQGRAASSDQMQRGVDLMMLILKPYLRPSPL